MGYFKLPCGHSTSEKLGNSGKSPEPKVFQPYSKYEYDTKAHDLNRLFTKGHQCLDRWDTVIKIADRLGHLSHDHCPFPRGDRADPEENPPSDSRSPNYRHRRISNGHIPRSSPSPSSPRPVWERDLESSDPAPCLRESGGGRLRPTAQRGQICKPGGDRLNAHPSVWRRAVGTVLRHQTGALRLEPSDLAVCMVRLTGVRPILSRRGYRVSC